MTMADATGKRRAPGDMTEDELLARARAAMTRAAALPPRSALRAIQWAVYDTYAGELGRRAVRLIAGQEEPC
jgi:L-ribulose-5-phosphate 3-epimerase UlaE